MTERVEGAGVELSATARGTGAPLLLVHDLAADARAWTGLTDALGEGVRTIAYDRRGYGDSGAPEPYERTTVQEQSEDARALLSALGAARGDAVAVGEGFGALVVLDLLVRLPALLHGAVLVAPPLNQFSPTAAAVLSDQRGLLEAALRDGGPAAAVAAWRPGADERVRAAHRAFFADFGGLASWPVTRRELRAVTVPVAVVTATATAPHLVESADVLAELLPAGRRIEAESPLGALRDLLGAS
ncbi:alpha/beta fold hydrolase [Conexibacter woesei]|uniref:AB hydrolase-1 domain-containing protein n=1 Tax=Conexibacter woesei (strain DSM 14684 / CCUG 47730 / CIP 108061 / JCM 11494 / NBRC 100937 / ID131577) TaxID=469383 RepID=D3FDJ3_CONWI|nr:alpha/beta fold hydrolase [Conexibacter woesei]ADB49567.1 hypothetical protein Cwoe_1136 [Conexibacter woesei DSM 14684]